MAKARRIRVSLGRNERASVYLIDIAFQFSDVSIEGIVVSRWSVIGRLMSEILNVDETKIDVQRDLVTNSIDLTT